MELGRGIMMPLKFSIFFLLEWINIRALDWILRTEAYSRTVGFVSTSKVLERLHAK
jgi:hypothetical protein